MRQELLEEFFWFENLCDCDQRETLLTEERAGVIPIP
jgi:hypothetical protein